MSRYRPEGNTIILNTVKLATREGSVMRRCVFVTISGNDYIECKETTYWSSEKTDNYGKPQPFPDGKGDMKSAVGLFGEMAFAIINNLDVDLSYRKNGDSCDFAVDGVTIDIKTAMKKSKGPHIRSRKLSTGRFDKMKDMYVVGYLADHNIDNHTAEVVLVGYFYRDEMESADEYISKAREDTANYDLYFSESNPLVEQ